MSRDKALVFFSLLFHLFSELCMSKVQHHRLSVHHSPVLYPNGLTYHHRLLSLAYGSSIILALLVLNVCAKFRQHRVTVYGGEIQVGYINFAIFDQYLAICGKR